MTSTQDLAERGRWREADHLTSRLIDQALRTPAGWVPDNGEIVYLAGGFLRPAAGAVGEGTAGHWRTALRAALMTNRGLDRTAAVRCAREVLDSEGARDAGCFWHAALALVGAGELATVEELCARAANSPSWPATGRHRDVLTLLRARLALLTGSPRLAAATLGEALRDGSGLTEQARGLAVAWQVAALIDLGRLGEAVDLMIAHNFAGDLSLVADRAELLAARGALRFATERFELACADFMAAGQHLTDLRVANPAVLPWQSRAALCAHAQGRSTLAGVLARQELAAARRWGNPQVTGAAAYAFAVIGGGRAPGAGPDVQSLREAEELLAAGSGPGLLQARYDLGLALLHGDQHRSAVELLVRTGAEAAEAGYARLAGACRTAVERESRRGVRGELTRQERRIAGLARAGRSNRQIADEELLAVRTVESHLSSVYRKLGIGGRRELKSIPLT